jgi:basic membrane lipoprotein Med (substrate-binding protein (PBP1-ABC) superfamily)
MRTRRFARLFAVVSVVALVAAACGGDDGGGGEGEGPAQMDIGIIFISPVEEPWNTSFLQALDRVATAKPHGLTITYDYTENVAPPDAERVLREMANSGEYEAIWAHSSFSDAVKVLKDEFPDILWAVSGAGNEALGGNAFLFYVYPHEPAYLQGIIAGMMTESDVVGAVAAFPYDDVNEPLHAYFEGARSVNSAIEIKNTYIESWFDPPKAKEAAEAQISAGADFIYAERFGPFEAVAANPGTYAFGHFVDQNSLAPEVVLTSALARWDPTIEVFVDAWWGHETEGAAYEAPTEKVGFLMKDGGADLAPYHDLESVIPQEVKDAVEDAKAQILDGSLVVPQDASPVEP